MTQGAEALKKPCSSSPSCPTALEPGEMRLQKALAQAGVSSRRAAEEIILKGRVAVNGEVVTELGYKVRAGRDRITVDGRVVAPEEKRVYLLFYKPGQCVTTARDPQGRRTVLDFIPDLGLRIFPVGRLDYDAEGLLLLTNDGELANRLQHPRYGVAKTYEVKVAGHPDEKALNLLRTGVVLEEGTTGPADVTLLRRLPRASWIRIVLHQGWNRQIKRMGEAVGHPVQKIKRVAYGPLELGRLEPGKFRHVTREELRLLLEQAQLSGEQARRK